MLNAAATEAYKKKSKKGQLKEQKYIKIYKNTKLLKFKKALTEFSKTKFVKNFKSISDTFRKLNKQQQQQTKNLNLWKTLKSNFLHSFHSKSK